MRRLIPLLSLLALAGCNDPVKIANTGQQTPYSAQMLRYAAKAGEIATVIHGNPFAGKANAEEIAAAIAPPGWLPRGTRLTTRPKVETPANIRIVLVFDPASNVLRDDPLCEAQAKPETLSPDARLRVHAVLCIDNKAVSWLSGEGRAAAAPSGKSFRNLMNQVMANLLPDRDSAG